MVIGTETAKPAIRTSSNYMI